MKELLWFYWKYIFKWTQQSSIVVKPKKNFKKLTSILLKNDPSDHMDERDCFGMSFIAVFIKDWHKHNEFPKWESNLFQNVLSLQSDRLYRSLKESMLIFSGKNNHFRQICLLVLDHLRDWYGHYWPSLLCNPNIGKSNWICVINFAYSWSQRYVEPDGMKRFRLRQIVFSWGVIKP